MAEKQDLISELGRARHRLLSFIEILPDDARMDAVICVNEFCDTAAREIEKAYWDGYKQYRLQTQLPKRPVAVTTAVSSKECK